MPSQGPTIGAWPGHLAICEQLKDQGSGVGGLLRKGESRFWRLPVGLQAAKEDRLAGE